MIPAEENETYAERGQIRLGPGSGSGLDQETFYGGVDAVNGVLRPGVYQAKIGFLVRDFCPWSTPWASS